MNVLDAPRLIYFEKAAASIGATPCDHRTGLGPLYRADDPRSPLDDSGFFSRNLLDRVPEEILVVEINRRDDGNLRLDNVRGVEPAAQADFVDGELHAMRGKRCKSHGCDAFKKRRMRGQLAGSHQRFDRSSVRASMRRRSLRRRCFRR